MNSLAECQLVVVTVNSSDTVACGQKITEVLHNNKNVPVFSLQRGVRHGAVLSEQ
jgi:ketopantoate reductase